ncbi:MAG TPA: bifunctional adenosylcobinamide kinase/adenosylcobinamide-phosphate guanylyltransferase [Thiothrix sp.]|nr:bifunctional adenosylcobinamide kinase/adenosylcobinamide-phosphate guanylyltransferase [Thiothrix sp.]
MANKTLILGGIRSGKSCYAELLLKKSSLSVNYIATAKADDEEMRQRIANHKASRPTNWRVIEEPYALAETLLHYDQAGHIFLVECLTLWITQLLCLDDDDRMYTELDAVHNILPTLKAEIIFVSNEVGLGIIPYDKISRRYVDIAGRFNQQIAKHVDNVVFVIAGLPHTIKSS